MRSQSGGHLRAVSMLSSKIGERLSHGSICTVSFFPPISQVHSVTSGPKICFAVECALVIKSNTEGSPGTDAEFDAASDVLDSGADACINDSDADTVADAPGAGADIEISAMALGSRASGDV